ncbi:unnamed protein product [Penicillium roqueforti FM164]|uniref:Genomic scaffold, ProqFM164S02 n=1 Tax=Penicillium roqueforti (strain FM164) TaxID=1365484 RepID=W6QF64_PENRF|nr:unnamed protein product [Penicillium roqueforti FM164]
MDESDPPVNEINAARIYTKYYSARYSRRSDQLEFNGITCSTLATISTNWQLPEVRLYKLPKKLKSVYHICISSAIKSTEAFDRVGGYRQFSNILVLSVSFILGLKELIELEQLKRLLVRTIGFLI